MKTAKEIEQRIQELERHNNCLNPTKSNIVNHENITKNNKIIKILKWVLGE